MREASENPATASGVLYCEIEINLTISKGHEDDFVSVKKVGGAEGTRTPDPLLAKQMLSQLSYSPI